MKELSDKQFDALLKQKAESFDYDFDESAWDKMEHKLRRRDRIIFIRNSSFALVLLLLCGGVYLLFDKESSVIDNKKQLVKELKTIKQDEKPAISNTKKNFSEPTLEQKVTFSKRADSQIPLQVKVPTRNKNNTGVSGNNISDKTVISETSAIDSFSNSLAIANANTPVTIQSTAGSSTLIQSVDSNALTITPNNTVATAEEKITAVENEAVSKRRRLVFSVTAMSGPEFSSIKSFSGSKGTLNAGFLLNAEISNKITLSSGLKYGIKNYAASSYDYHLKNPSRAGLISGIDASCNVLEIPLQVSYTLLDANNKQIRISSGLSSYLMLKEEYSFKYTAQSGYKDYLLVKSNANQHYLSVLSLSASYLIKPKSSHLQWAIEPYVKLPMGGVGEGNVRLKSSGISLNLTYDIRKKSK